MTMKLDKMTDDQKRELCDRIAVGKASTKDFTHVMGLPFECFLSYAQMTPIRMLATAESMRKQWRLV